MKKKRDGKGAKTRNTEILVDLLQITKCKLNAKKIPMFQHDGHKLLYSCGHIRLRKVVWLVAGQCLSHNHHRFEMRFFHDFWLVTSQEADFSRIAEREKLFRNIASSLTEWSFPCLRRMRLWWSSCTDRRTSCCRNGSHQNRAEQCMDHLKLSANIKINIWIPT